MLSPNKYMQNSLAISSNVENKKYTCSNDKQFVWSLGSCVLYLKNNHTVIQKQYIFEWNQKLNQIILLLWWNKNNLTRYCQDLKYTTISVIPLGSLSRTKIYKHSWHNILFHHVVTDYCYPEKVILLLSYILFYFSL